MMINALFPDLVVNGETVPHVAVATEVQNHHAPKGKPGIAWRKAANAIAIRTLLVQEARRRGLKPAPEEVAPGRFETEEEALIRGLLESAVVAETPGEDEVRREWVRDPSRFRSPPLWEVSHILCACDPRDREARNAARARANDLTRQVIERPGSFAVVAMDQSDCSSKSIGGALGQLGPGDTVPEFEAALRDLVAGQITPTPVLTRHGWHVIRMDALAEGAVLPFDAVRGRISDALEKTSWARAAREFIAELTRTAEITGAELKPIRVGGSP